MTDKEKAIVMAYTGVVMLKGDKIPIFYKYVEQIMGRPILTHEMAQLAKIYIKMCWIVRTMQKNFFGKYWGRCGRFGRAPT